MMFDLPTDTDRGLPEIEKPTDPRRPGYDEAQDAYNRQQHRRALEEIGMRSLADELAKMDDPEQARRRAATMRTGIDALLGESQPQAQD